MINQMEKTEGQCLETKLEMRETRKIENIELSGQVQVMHMNLAVVI